MAEHSTIEWTDATWNPITGCSVVSPGCKHCYAMRLAGTRLQHHPTRAGLTQMGKEGPVWTGEVRLNEQWLDQPLRWKRPRMIFVCAHADLFHEAVPDAWIDKVFAVMLRANRHTFQVLTKRADRMRSYVEALYALGARDAREWFDRGMVTSLRDGWTIPRHIWLGVSAEDQQRADERIPHLLATPAAVRWVSAEPLLGPIDLRAHFLNPQGFVETPRWVVAGGESGPGARPSHPDWFRSLRDQCGASGVPFHFKQHGDWREWDHQPDTDQVDNDSEAADAIAASATNPAWISQDGRVFHRREDLPADVPCRLVERLGKGRAGRLLDGVEHNGMPDHG